MRWLGILFIFLIGCTTENYYITEQCKETKMITGIAESFKGEYYTYSPTGCSNPKSTFTACDVGCDYIWSGTGSMRPFLGKNVRVTIQGCDNYSVGDIVVYRTRPMVELNISHVCHQIVNKTGDRFVTKGANNNYIDAQRPNASEILGKVTKIEYLGVENAIG